MAFTFSGSVETLLEETTNRRKTTLYRKHTSLGETSIPLRKTSQLGVCEGLALDGPRVAPEFDCKSVYRQSIPLQIYDKWPKQLSHHSHEGARSIGQSKGRAQPFIQPVFSFKPSFPFVSLPDSNLVVPTFKINLGEAPVISFLSIANFE